MNPHHKSSQNPRSSLRSKFTYGFLQALSCINKQRSTSPFLSSADTYQRYRKVKLAADASMAYAVGPRRAWSRAMLWKIARRRRLMSRQIRGNRPGRREGTRKSKMEIGEDDHKITSGHARELQKLVPGGEVMNLSSLLSETAHYIKCLNTQVEVMRKIADFYSV